MPSFTRIAAMLGGLAHQFFSLLLLLLVEARFGAGRYSSGGLLGRLIRSCGKVLVVYRPERVGLPELMQRVRERVNKSGRNPRLAENDVHIVFLQAAGRQLLDLAVEPQRTDQPHPVDEARHDIVDAAGFQHAEVAFVAGRFNEVAMLAHEIPELRRNGGTAQHGDVMSDEIVKRGKFQLPGIGRTHEEDPLVPRQRLLGKVAEALALVIAERRKNRVALAPKDQPRGPSPGKLLKRGFPTHGGEHLLEDFGTESRRLAVGQVLVRYPLIGDKLQGCGRRWRSAECPGGGKCHAKKSAEPFANSFRHRRPRSSTFQLPLLLLMGSKAPGPAALARLLPNLRR